MAYLSRRRAIGGAAALSAALAGGLAGTATAAGRGSGRGTVPLRQAHAHNDYEHDRPLHDALAHGFTSVEADIWLVDGQLLVAHDAVDLDPARTLESLYLDPLADRVRANGGRVHRGHQVSLQLLIDIKNTGEATYLELSRRLREYDRIFSSARGGRVRTRAVTAVISGDRAARAPMEREGLRYAFYDGRLDDLGTAAPASFIPLISSNWNSSFRWLGEGPMPAAERELLHRITGAAHAAGQRVRFWATPDVPGAAREAVWRELLAAGVDHLNTDDLAGLEAFLRAAGR
ncbi:phosphatidylinositol-specific phospholipase C/glycerophosphodiester phosphodiesterase family protein [Streptomyces litchfieldiae]|uniref:Altered inheritance of mitochondria protein 6 n=1 Tax=Streptomyces litchfieldiae TaxID=3075543 RepID=A0ABU2MME8_9ACTN|nr:phosphatidylinositol-specific phospholipase C/glycerophosphodiester phosphodiesterase family protein [Streptomyces sp. DSM 44938]MDT0341829.1 phosphatidylinositol-specific phospholipase C/glycerophosphodiester phosphodiesterase family protein [Streptomyces sp. DSM 44938]